MSVMFDPVYVTEAINDILGRRGIHYETITPDLSQNSRTVLWQEEKKQAASTAAAKNPVQ